jgi:hypothetical protein
VLILANGPFQCGSDWQHRIVEQLVDAEPPPAEFQNPGWRAPSFDSNRLGQFLSTRQHVDRGFIARNHIRDPQLKRLLLDDPYVRVLTIIRDLREVVASAYEHDRKRGFAEGDVEAYYWGRGQERITGVLNHHRLWNVGHAGVFVGSYERLRASFEAEVRSMASFLGVELMNREIEAIRKATPPGKADAGRGPLGPGMLGDSQSDLSDAILEDLERRVANAP